jgi:hypothetical protein
MIEAMATLIGFHSRRVACRANTISEIVGKFPSEVGVVGDRGYSEIDGNPIGAELAR